MYKYVAFDTLWLNFLRSSPSMWAGYDQIIVTCLVQQFAFLTFPYHLRCRKRQILI